MAPELEGPGEKLNQMEGGKQSDSLYFREVMRFQRMQKFLHSFIHGEIK